MTISNIRWDLVTSTYEIMTPEEIEFNTIMSSFEEIVRDLNNQTEK